MSFSGSLHAETDRSMDNVQELLERTYRDEGYDPSSGIPRVIPDFDENKRRDVFAQTNEFNAFYTRENVSFNGISRHTRYEELDELSRAVLDVTADIYLGSGDGSDVLDELDWM